MDFFFIMSTRPPGSLDAEPLNIHKNISPLPNIINCTSNLGASICDAVNLDRTAPNETHTYIDTLP